MIRAVVNESMTRAKARRAFLRAGWRFIGGGSFAAVFASPDGTRVAKVTKPDRGGEATYRVSKELEGNPHLPRYFDRMPLANGGHVYEVERLIPLKGWSELEEAELRADGTVEYMEAWNALEAASPMGFVNDSHWANAMLRPTGELVMTDYLADINELAHASVSQGDAMRGHFSASDRHGSNHWRDAA